MSTLKSLKTQHCYFPNSYSSLPPSPFPPLIPSPPCTRASSLSDATSRSFSSLLRWEILSSSSTLSTRFRITLCSREDWRGGVLCVCGLCVDWNPKILFSNCYAYCAITKVTFTNYAPHSKQNNVGANEAFSVTAGSMHTFA